MVTTMARKHSGGTSADPKNDPFHIKLSRLLDAKRKGRTDVEIAEASGMTKQSFSRLLNGGVPDPRLSTIMGVLKAIGASLSDYDRA